jgi:hypothetical protein
MMETSGLTKCRQFRNGPREVLQFKFYQILNTPLTHQSDTTETEQQEQQTNEEQEQVTEKKADDVEYYSLCANAEKKGSKCWWRTAKSSVNFRHGKR